MFLQTAFEAEMRKSVFRKTTNENNQFQREETKLLRVVLWIKHAKDDDYG